MAHVDMQLVSRIVRTGEIDKVLEWGITADDLQTTEGHGMFQYLKTYHTLPETRGAVPGPNAIKAHFGTFELCDDPSMTLEALCSEVRKNRMAKEAEKVMRDGFEDLYRDPVGVIATMQRQMEKLSSLGLKMQDETFASAMDNLIERYDKMEQGIGLSGLSWPWEPFQEATAGIQEDDYIVLYGRPKSMKSFVLSKMAAHSYEEGKKVMVYTKEMPTWQIFRRIAACTIRLPYDELRLGKLKPREKQALLYLHQEVKEQARLTDGQHNIITLSGKDAPAGTDNISWLRSKILKHRPNIVYIDGLYLMSAEGKGGKDHEKVASISRACRQMVLDTGTPVVATMQANRQAAKHERAELDEIAFSDAIGQDATCAIRVINEKDAPTIGLIVGGSREFHLHAVRIWGIPCSNFSYKEAMSEKEIKKAEQNDAKPEEKETAASQVRKPITEKNQQATKAVQEAINRI